VTLLTHGKSRITTDTGITFCGNSMVGRQRPLCITMSHHTVAEGVIEATAGTDNSSCRQVGSTGGTQICASRVADGTGRSVARIRVGMGGWGTKPGFGGMGCRRMTSQTIFLADSSPPIICAMTVRTECHAVHPNGSGLGVDTMSNGIAPACRVPERTLGVAGDPVPIGTETTDIADTASQVGTMTLLAFFRSRQKACRVISANICINPAGRMFAGCIKNNRAVIGIVTSPERDEHEKHYTVSEVYHSGSPSGGR